MTECKFSAEASLFNAGIKINSYILSKCKENSDEGHSKMAQSMLAFATEQVHKIRQT